MKLNKRRRRRWRNTRKICLKNIKPIKIKCIRAAIQSNYTDLYKHSAQRYQQKILVFFFTKKEEEDIWFFFIELYLINMFLQKKKMSKNFPEIDRSKRKNHEPNHKHTELNEMKRDARSMRSKEIFCIVTGWKLQTQKKKIFLKM